MQSTTPSNDAAQWSGQLSNDAQNRNLAAIALAEAMHRARMQDLQNSDVELDEVVSAAPVSSQMRLQALRNRLEALYTAIPQDVQGMDLGVVREDKPRLFLDMLSFVDIREGNHDFRLVQQGRNGEQVLLETKDETALIARITDYIAQRLILRERSMEGIDPVVSGAAHFSRGVAAASTAPVQNPVLQNSEEGHRSRISEPRIVETKKHPANENSVSGAHEKTLAVLDKSLEPMRIVATSEEPIKAGLSAVASAPADARAYTSSSSFGTSNATIAARTVASAAATAAIKRQQNPSWWLWPALAVLLGMAFGAYLLYLYAINFTA
jgi:hypothetical protein